MPQAQHGQSAGCQHPRSHWCRHRAGKVEAHQAARRVTPAIPDDLAAVVVGVGVEDVPARDPAKQGVQVDQGAVFIEIMEVQLRVPQSAKIPHGAVLVEEGVHEAVRTLAVAGNLATVIDVERNAVDARAHIAQLGQLAVAKHEPRLQAFSLAG